VRSGARGGGPCWEGRSFLRFSCSLSLSLSLALCYAGRSLSLLSLDTSLKCRVSCPGSFWSPVGGHVLHGVGHPAQQRCLAGGCDGCRVCGCRFGRGLPLTGKSLGPKLQTLTLKLTPKPETRNPKPETRNSKPETRNPKPETQTQVASVNMDSDLGNVLGVTNGKSPLLAEEV